jgi:hypothetical protein
MTTSNDQFVTIFHVLTGELDGVAAVPYVNRILKNSHVPLKFITNLRKSRYSFANEKFVEYVNLYVEVKQKYGLSFIHNNINTAKAACR